jgi:TRAP transporter 4TM/12TM fusion protein
MAVLGFLGLGALRSMGEPQRPTGRPAVVRRLVTAILIGAALGSCGYLVIQHQELVRRAGAATPLDFLAGGVAVLVVLELARRTTGWGLVSVAFVAIAYALVGPWLPGLLAHRGYTIRRLIEHLYLTTEGIWGVPLGVSADFVYLFVLFGAVLDAAGGGQLLIALASKIAGRTHGGPAKTAAVASALMGSLSGSAVANVVTTGSLTIPIMKRVGFHPQFAAAIEAAASTGGQLMPPIMGAGAFILATWTNIPYVRVATAAIIPALLYYAALFMAIHFRAEQAGLTSTAEKEAAAVLPRLHLLAPLGIIVVLLAMGRSPMRAAFWGVVAAAIATLFAATTRLDLERARVTVAAAASGTVQVAAACAAAGIVVGVASLTGIGLRMSELIVTLSGGHLPAALILTAVGAIVLGMGLPTTAAYIVLAALGAPALTELGVPMLAAHLFIFYFGCLSNVTPPVALAAYAASGIAGSPPMRTAVTAMALAGAGFLVPFMFVYGPPLLLEAAAPIVLIATVTGIVGVTALSAAIIGFARHRLSTWQRLLLAIAAGVLIFPGVVSDLLGIAAIAVVFSGRAAHRHQTGAL